LSGERLGRRLALGVALATALAARAARARGREAVGGRLSFRVPWPLGAIDPHRLEDPAAALFGGALFDQLYAYDRGEIVPSLAESAPEPEGAKLRVRLRAGVHTARGRPFEANDAQGAIARARSSGARAWLADVPTPKVEGRSLVFAMRDAARLAAALASPLVAMTPSAFSPEAPDGTGPFRFSRQGDHVVLSRNPLAASGPAFLDEAIVRRAPDLAASLRAFESGTDDLGWHGSGLHNVRAGSRAFDAGPVAWAVLFTGRDAQTWDAPGVAQRVCDGVPPSTLAYLALGPPWPQQPAQGWGGPAGALVVRDDAPWLVELARALAGAISRPGHEVTARPVAAAELSRLRASRLHMLALDLVRPLAPGSFGARVALATADNAIRATALVKHPPLGDVAPRTMTRTLRCGVVGEVTVKGGRAADVQLAKGTFGLDLASSTRTRGR
jgi:peptide/nickel transport system substrate-binding protein